MTQIILLIMRAMYGKTVQKYATSSLVNTTAYMIGHVLKYSSVINSDYFKDKWIYITVQKTEKKRTTNVIPCLKGTEMISRYVWYNEKRDGANEIPC
jgi:hypothetical protein